MGTISSHSDEHLVSLLLDSNEPAFTEIYNRYWKPLYYTAYKILQVNEAAQDAVQNVFISLWKRRGEAEINSLESYLHQATRFQVFKAIRADKADKDFYKRLAVVSKEILTEEPMLFKELDGLFHAVIQTLPEDEREIYRMHREEGLTYKQIAEEKGISVKTVEKKMSNALKKIRLKFDNPLLFALFMHFLK